MAFFLCYTLVMNREKLFAYAVPLGIYILCGALVASLISALFGYEISEKLRYGFLFGFLIYSGFTIYISICFL